MLSRTSSRFITYVLRGPSCSKAVRTFSLSTPLANTQQEKDDLIKRIKIAPIERTNETMDKKRSRLVYQSRKRGILETDLLLSGFAAKYLKDMNKEQLNEYDSLLNELDWDIYYWATKNFNYSPLPKRWENSKILAMLQDFCKNKEKEIIQMPTLNKYK
ncbi:hypothetical protein NCAS_0B05220 [Naumovozyma castellii]|uniref:Succinate dehydrogenase assembly factor 2, mitochondrial n=1 Tax=Naumovozyma castellii TaxID=27288 RepID=G0V9J0_NAUCA|nr:hypothetical protein NCAS_0B05220 [Naumovozyma castellii CBS 4309]CCC68606.1 hypothetical protein NCAS_0B05220 [Naumovozyma castellii CBS 4309]